MAFTQKIFTSFQPYSDGDTRIGELYRLWYDSNTNTLRIQLDNNTPGGTVIGGSGGGSYTLPTASTTTKGGVKIDGTTITIDNQVISATQPDLSSYATQSYVTSQGYITNSTTTIVGDDSTGVTLNSGETIKIAGTQNITTAVSGDTLTITGPDLSSYATTSYVTSQGYITNSTITVLGDDSTGTVLNSGESVKIAGTQNITTAVSGDTVTITGPNLSSYATQSYVTSQGYITNSPITVVGDDSSGVTLNSGETIKIAGTQNITTAVSGDTLTITGPTLTSYATKTGEETLTNKTISGSSNTLSNIGNSSLTNSSVTINGTSVSLGATATLSSLVNGSDTLSLNGANKVDLPGGTSYIFSATNNITLAPDNTGSNYLEIINNTGVTLSTDRAFDIRTNADGTARSWSFSQGGVLFFPDFTYQSTAYTATAAKALFSASNASASGSGGSLSYSDGVFTFTPALNITGNAATVTNGVYTTDTGTVTNTMLAGSIANAKLANSSITVNGTSVSLGASGTVTAAAGTLTGTTLNSTVVTSSLTSVGTLTNLTVSGSATVSSNSATDKYINVGTHGQLFDDGNLHIHASSGTLWINSLDSGNIKIGTQYNSGSGSDVDIGKNLIVNSGSVTANAATAFIAGDNAISGVALQVPREGGIRNLYNGANNMYFDVSIGGSTDGAFVFRSSSAYTSVANMSPTAVSFNTGATFTSRTPSVARTAFNAAIDTEITVDSMRFRISNQGGIFPQVIGDGSSRNLAWTAVGAINAAAINQVGSTGTIVSTSAWTTLYNSHGMDAAGDTITVTLQDKAAGRIYRVTFMRSDNGSTTGYNIIGERIL